MTKAKVSACRGGREGDRLREFMSNSPVLWIEDLELPPPDVLMLIFSIPASSCLDIGEQSF